MTIQRSSASAAPGAATLPPAPPAMRYYSLDIWRGVACLLVLLMHSISYAPIYRAYVGQIKLAAPTTAADRVVRLVHVVLGNLWIGVPMFFVISGYCIMAAVDSMRRRGGSLGEYFWRRFRRIYPPYWTAVALALLVVALCALAPWPELYGDHQRASYRPGDFSAAQWLGNLTLTESWRPNVAGDRQSYFMGTTWTLCYEEQFYALAGLILLCWPTRMFRAALGVTLAAVVARFAAARWNVPIDGFFFDGYWLQFAAGILVYYRLNYASPRAGRAITRLLAGAALAGIALRGYLPANVDRWTVVALAFAWLIAVLHPWDKRVFASRWLSPLAYCGRLCYSMYLVHWPISKAVAHALLLSGVDGPWQTLLLTVPLCVAASVAVAALFHHFVERRFLNTPLPNLRALRPAPPLPA